MILTLVENLLRERIGLDPSVAGHPLLRRAVLARLQAIGWTTSDFDQYEKRLSANDVELRALIEEVVVSESWFFRDGIPFKYLSELAADGWQKRSDRSSLKVLCVPCSRGEEPYSVAMTFVQLGLPADRFRIDAVDLSKAAIDQAKAGIYPDNAFRTADLRFRDDFFDRESKGYRLRDSIRPLVKFHQGNLLGDETEELFPHSKYDVIFCRNLLIYFDQAARSKAIERLCDRLADGGVLFVGHAEGVSLLGKDFRSVGERGAFAFKRQGCLKEELPRPQETEWKPALFESRIGSVSVKKPLANASMPLPIRADPPKPPIPSPRKPSTLQDAANLADQGSHSDAAAICLDLITRNGTSTEAYFLLGIIRQASGNRLEAERCFEKVLYLDRRHEEALLALALLAQRRGDTAAADNYRRRADKVGKERA